MLFSLLLGSIQPRTVHPLLYLLPGSRFSWSVSQQANKLTNQRKTKTDNKPISGQAEKRTGGKSNRPRGSNFFLPGRIFFSEQIFSSESKHFSSGPKICIFSSGPNFFFWVTNDFVPGRILSSGSNFSFGSIFSFGPKTFFWVELLPLLKFFFRVEKISTGPNTFFFRIDFFSPGWTFFFLSVEIFSSGSKKSFLPGRKKNFPGRNVFPSSGAKNIFFRVDNFFFRRNIFLTVVENVCSGRKFFFCLKFFLSGRKNYFSSGSKNFSAESIFFSWRACKSFFLG